METIISKYKCELCDKSFSQSSSRNRHVKEKHLKPNIYHCEQCESRFSKKYNLQVHIKNVHSNKRKEMKCSRCDRVFTKAVSFGKHFKDPHGCPESDIFRNASSEHANDKDAQSLAESVLKELKQLQFDIQTSNIPISPCFENDQEIAKIEKSAIQTITRADGLQYFICDFCSKEFRKSYSFLRHRRVHTKLRPFVCVLCKAAFSTTAQLKSHCSIHKLHEELGLFHKLYKCPKCDEGFCTVQQFDKHISLPSGCKVSFKCPKCLKGFSTLRKLLRHKHPEEDSELEILKKILPVPLTASEELQLPELNINSFECDICGINIKGKTSFNHHIKRHENLYKNHCAKCQKSFATMSTLKIHKKRHLGGKHFKCHYCNSSFSTTQSCRRHMETHLKSLLHTHEDEKDTIGLFPTFIENSKNEPTATTTISIIRKKKPLTTKEEKVNTAGSFKYKCSECEQSYRYNSWLKKHFKYKHSNELPFKCDTCCREFRTKQSLESHYLVHSTKRLKTTCQVCGRLYASSKSLKLHLRIHTQETPFSCENCCKQFRTSGHLIQHRKIYHMKKL